MKHLVFTFLSCLVVVFGFTKSSNNKEEQQIIQLENKWMNAMMHKDSITLNQMMSPDMQLAGKQNFERTISRATWIMNTMHHLDVDSVNFTKIKVQVNDNVGIARSLFFWKGAFDKKQFADSVYLVDVWVNKNNRWQVVSRMISE